MGRKPYTASENIRLSRTF